ncbi:MAG: HAMP domain-containing histidine kinase [Rubrivivax sp.]|nr:HAMP domain-containing histidine kinase [Rubrivivax sp.]
MAIGLIVLSTAALSFVSYYHTAGRENLAETSLVQSNIKLAQNYVEAIEKSIVDNDLLLLGMIDVNEPSKWPAMVEAVKRSDLNVDQVYFLRPPNNYPLYPPYSPQIRNQWGAFINSFRLKDLNLEDLALDQPYHLHMERPNNYFFATYAVKETRQGYRILVCFQMNFDRIMALLDKHLRNLQDRFYVSVVDYENNGVYGQPLSRTSKYFFETRFPNTLYKWILQIVPRNYAEIERGMKNQRRTNLVLITLSMFLTFLSLAVISVAWRRDRQLRKLKEDFISNVSHELKTPLSLIRMFSEILVTNRVQSDEKRREYFEIIHVESDRMSRLINNLLDFASLSQGVDRKYFEKTNIAQLVAKTLEAYGHEIRKEGFELNLEMADDIPDSFADPNAITMAFINLVDNSVKYSGDRKRIEVQVAKADGCVNISVRDQGIGIPPAEQQRIFEKFYRGSAPSIRRIRGSGIGLAITKHVAEMHGGEILVESEPGKGSAFTLKIPIRDAPVNSKSGIRDSRS